MRCWKERKGINIKGGLQSKGGTEKEYENVCACTCAHLCVNVCIGDSSELQRQSISWVETSGSMERDERR